MFLNNMLNPRKLLIIIIGSIFLGAPVKGATIAEQAFVIGILASEKCQIRKGENGILLRSIIEKEVKKMGIDLELLNNKKLNEGAYAYSLDLNASCDESLLSEEDQESLLMKYIEE